MTAVALALVAGLLFAVGAGMQHRAARASLAAVVSAPAGKRRARLRAVLPISAVLGRLVRNRIWLAGWVVNIGGFAVQAVALHRGSVGLVQPVLVTQLLFTIPVAALQTGRRPAPGDWAAGACVCVGIGLFVGVWGTEQAAVGPDRDRVLGAVIVALGLAMMLVLGGSGARPGRRAALASIAAGLCFASTAVLTKVTFDDVVSSGAGRVASDWPVYVLVLSAVLGLLIAQDALAAGSLPTAVAGMAITNPLASAGIGVLAFHESGPSGAGAAVGLSVAAVLLTLGVIGLAQSPTLRVAVGPPPGPPAGPAAPRPVTVGPIAPGPTMPLEIVLRYRPTCGHPGCLPPGWPQGVPVEACKAPL